MENNTLREKKFIFKKSSWLLKREVKGENLNHKGEPKYRIVFSWEDIISTQAELGRLERPYMRKDWIEHRRWCRK